MDCEALHCGKTEIKKVTVTQKKESRRICYCVD